MLIDNDSHITETQSICIHNRNTLVNFRYKNGQHFPGIFPGSLADCSMEKSIKYNFFIDLESIQHKLLSEYSLNVSRTVTLVVNFSPYKPLQHIHF